jgi:hypothetical protein
MTGFVTGSIRRRMRRDDPGASLKYYLDLA